MVLESVLERLNPSRDNVCPSLCPRLSVNARDEWKGQRRVNIVMPTRNTVAQGKLVAEAFRALLIWCVVHRITLLFSASKGDWPTTPLAFARQFGLPQNEPKLSHPYLIDANKSDPDPHILFIVPSRDKYPSARKHRQFTLVD